MSPTRSPLSHPGRAKCCWLGPKKFKSSFTNLPSLFSWRSLISICRTACDLEESGLTPVAPLLLTALPYSSTCSMVLNLSQTSHVCSTSLLKTLWEKEKLLITSNFSFSKSAFYPSGKLSAIVINLKLSSANSFSSEESKICHFGRG